VVPGPGDTQGMGESRFIFYPNKHKICYTIQVSGIARATSAHLHEAPAQKSAVRAGGFALDQGFAPRAFLGSPGDVRRDRPSSEGAWCCLGGAAPGARLLWAPSRALSIDARTIQVCAPRT